MKYRFVILAALAVGAVALVPNQAVAQSGAKAPAKKAPAKPAKSVAENGLVGIRLYDLSTKVLSKFGAPDIIEPVMIGSSAVGPAGGAGGPGPAGFGGGGGMPAGPSRGGAPQMGAPELGPPPGAVGTQTGPSDFGFGSELFRQQTATMGLPPKRVPPGDPNAGASGPPQGMSPQTGPPGGFGAGGGAPRGGNMASGSSKYTRWIYNRPNSKYAFVVNGDGKIVQCEAVGIRDSNVRTNKGTSFGSTFTTLIKSYGNPDGYEIAGDTFVVKFLKKHKVAFRLSRLDPNRPHVVTGVVVAGGTD